MKVVLKCTTMELGVQFVMTGGVGLMPVLSVECWDIQEQYQHLAVLTLDEELGGSGWMRLAVQEVKIVCLTATTQPGVIMTVVILRMLESCVEVSMCES